MPVQARVVQGTAECLMSISGTDSIHLSMPAQFHEPGFAVQMKDLQGNPLSGLEVWFYVDQPLQGLVPPGTPPLPPAETYGRITSGEFRAFTDQQGIARSGPFTGGTLSGAYDVVAFVRVSGLAPNDAACRTSPGPMGYFRVNQRFRVSVGAANAIPTLSSLASLLLGLAMLGVGLISTRRAHGG